MNMKILSVLSLLAAVAFCGCSRQKSQPTHTVFLIDVSGSIEPDSLKEAFRAIAEFTSRAARGDRVTVIPITSDALIESSGRIIRFTKPTKRKAYDADIAEFTNSIEKPLNDLKAKALAHPADKTDILNTIRLADEEMATDPKGMKSDLKILSDFIEEDDEYNFKSDPRLTNQHTAMELARTLAKPSAKTRFTTIYLGMLRSKDLRSLARTRREAIEQFWRQYFASEGTDVRFAIDGVGSINSDREH
jgi:hypothetical protein